MNLPLFRRTIAANAVRVVVIALGLMLMGIVMPLMYATFGKDLDSFVQTIPLFAQFSNFGGGDLFTLTGMVAMGFAHPFTLLLMGIMAVVFPALAIAGEREKGTLEVTLSRPISRHGLYATLFVAGLLFIMSLAAVLVATISLSIAAVGFADAVSLARFAQLWVADVLLFVAIMSLAFAASVESDRAGPAIGIPAVFVLLNYLAFAIGSIWPDASWLQDYSMFDLLKAKNVLDGGLAPGDVAVMVLFASVFIGIGWYRFPRRDLPAPA